MSTPPVRTLFLSSCVLGGGAGWSMYYLLKYLDRRAIEPVVVVPSRGIFGARFAELGVSVQVIRRLHDRTNQLRWKGGGRAAAGLSYALNLFDAVWLIPELARLIRRERIQLVYCNNMMVKPMGVLASRLAGVPCVLHARNIHEARSRVWFYGKLAGSRVVKRVIANSAATAAPYRRRVPEKVSVIHNGIDFADYRLEVLPRGEFRTRYQIDPDAVLVGLTGWLIPRKGLEPLIRAAAALLPSRPKLEFVAVGRVPVNNPVDYRARYEGLARELGIAERFRFVGFLEDVRPAVVDFDVLAMPSLQEPFGRSIIEAMALGTPVVASRVGGIPEIIRHAETGLLVPPGDAPALAAAIASLVDDPARRRALAQAALSDVRQRFDVAALSRSVQQLLVAASQQL
jgi:glycosyltransferase involved in cell wall biosynthesis